MMKCMLRMAVSATAEDAENAECQTGRGTEMN